MELCTVSCEEAPRCNLVMHMDTAIVTVPVEISGRMIRTLAGLNRQCRRALRHLTLCQQWTREIKQVQVLEDSTVRIMGVTPCCLWFPQIPFQIFAEGGYKGIQPAVSYVTDAHACNHWHYPAWYITNERTSVRSHHDYSGQGRNQDIVQVHTPLEAWEASNLHRRVECVDFELPLKREVVTPPPRRLYRELRIDHQMAGKIIALKSSNSPLPRYLDTVTFSDETKITRVLDSLCSWGIVYPQIKYIQGFAEICELPDVYLDRLDRLFPRFICICARDLDGRLADRYGNRFHAWG